MKFIQIRKVVLNATILLCISCGYTNKTGNSVSLDDNKVTESEDTVCAFVLSDIYKRPEVRVLSFFHLGYPDFYITTYDSTKFMILNAYSSLYLDDINDKLLLTIFDYSTESSNAITLRRKHYIDLPTDARVNKIEDAIFKNNELFVLYQHGIMSIKYNSTNDSFKVARFFNFDKLENTYYRPFKFKIEEDGSFTILHYRDLSYISDTLKQKFPEKGGWFIFDWENGIRSKIHPLNIEMIGMSYINRQYFANFIHGKLIYTDGYSGKIFVVDTDKNIETETDIEPSLSKHPQWKPLPLDSIKYMQSLSRYIHADLIKKLTFSWSRNFSRIREFFEIGAPSDSCFAIVWKNSVINVNHPPTYVTVCKFINGNLTLLHENLPFPNKPNYMFNSQSHFINTSAIFTPLSDKGLVLFSYQLELDSFVYYVLNPNIEEQITTDEYYEKRKNWSKTDNIEYEPALLFYRYNFNWRQE